MKKLSLRTCYCLVIDINRFLKDSRSKGMEFFEKKPIFSLKESEKGIVYVQENTYIVSINN